MYRSAVRACQGFSRPRYLHIVVNNAYLGLIRQAQRGFDMDYCVQLSFDNVNAPEVGGYGVDHVKVAEGLGCKAVRVLEPDRIAPALEEAKKLMAEYRVPVVVEVILERVTNVSMGTELDNITEFEAAPPPSGTRARSWTAGKPGAAAPNTRRATTTGPSHGSARRA